MSVAHALTDTKADISAAVASQSVTLPTGAGSTHRLILVVTSMSGVGTAQTISMSSGWTRIGSGSVQQALGGSEIVQVDAYHALGTVGATTIGNNHTGGNFQQGYVVAAFTGVDTTTPIDVVGSGNSITASATLTVSSITTVTDQAWDCIAAGDWLGTSAETCTGFTVSENAHSNSAAALLYNTTAKSIGATGTATINAASGSTQDIVALRFALRPAGGGGTAYADSVTFAATLGYTPTGSAAAAGSDSFALTSGLTLAGAAATVGSGAFPAITATSFAGSAAALGSGALAATPGHSASAGSTATGSATFAATSGLTLGGGAAAAGSLSLSAALALAQSAGAAALASLGLTGTPGDGYSGAATAADSCGLSAALGFIATTGQAIQVSCDFAATLGLSQAATANVQGLVTQAATLGYSVSGSAATADGTTLAAALAIAQLAQAASAAGLSLGVASTINFDTTSGGTVSPAILLILYASGQNLL